MSISFVSDGDVIDIVSPGTTAGVGVLQGQLWGVAETTTTAGQRVAIRVRGVVRIKKLSTAVTTVGIPLYWDDTNKQVNVTATSQHKVGLATEAVGSGPTMVNMLIERPPALASA
jgi:predicted RecA/RadA family phage recombinase